MVALEGGNTSIFNTPVHRFLGTYSGKIKAQSDLGYVWKAGAVSDVLSASWVCATAPHASPRQLTRGAGNLAAFAA
jgi:hypothetical protein